MIDQPTNTRLLPMRRLALPVILVVCFVLFVFGVGSAQQSNPETAAANAAAAEREKLAIERDRLDVEKVRLRREGWQFYLTIVSIVFPLLILGLTLWLQARTSYKLQAVEIIMASKSTDAARKKVEILKTLLPNSITREFDQAFEQRKMPGTAYQQKKVELFKAMAAKATTEGDVFNIFQALYLNEPPLINEFIRNFKAIAPGTPWVSALNEVSGKPKEPGV